VKSKEVSEGPIKILQTSFRLDNQSHLLVGRIYERIKAEPVPDGCVIPSVAVVFGFLLHQSIQWIKDNNVTLGRLNVDPAKNLTIKLMKSDDEWLENATVPATEGQVNFAASIGLELPEECLMDTRKCAAFIADHTSDDRKASLYRAAVIPKYALVVACINLAYDYLSSKEIVKDIYQWPAYNQLYSGTGKR